jgi:hypothetical protein
MTLTLVTRICKCGVITSTGARGDSTTGRTFAADASSALDEMRPFRFLISVPQCPYLRKSVSRGIIDLIPSRDKAFWPSRVLRINVIAFPVVLHVRCVVTGERSWRWFVYLSFSPTGKIAGCNCGKASVSPCAFTSGGNRRFPQVSKKNV